MIGISTSAGNHKKLDKILKETKIFFAELNYRDTIKDFYKSKKIFDKYQIPFLGLHAPAPLEKPVKNASRLIDLVSGEKEVIRDSLKYLRNSIKFAYKNGMKYVILHAGGHENIGTEIVKEKVNQEYIKEFLKQRKKKRKIYLERFFKNFEKILNLCEKLKIKIALEVRYYPGEFPDFFELKKIFEEMDSEYLGYWHDTGHAWVKEKIVKDLSYFENFKNKLTGVHVHDIKGTDEHKPPGYGEFDFQNFFKKAIKNLKNIYIVLEIHKKYSEEKIIKGIKKIERIAEVKKIVPRISWKPYKVKNEKFNLHIPERIILHHTAIPSRKEYKGFKTIKKIQKEHLKRGFNDIGYHFIITPEGNIVEGRNIFYEGAHTKSKNKGSTGITLIGNFEEEKPLKKQIKALKVLIKILKKFFKIKEIKVHHHYNPYTKCPGRNFVSFLPDVFST